MPASEKGRPDSLSTLDDAKADVKGEPLHELDLPGIGTKADSKGGATELDLSGVPPEWQQTVLKQMYAFLPSI